MDEIIDEIQVEIEEAMVFANTKLKPVLDGTSPIRTALAIRLIDHSLELTCPGITEQSTKIIQTLVDTGFLYSELSQ